MQRSASSFQVVEHDIRCASLFSLDIQLEPSETIAKSDSLRDTARADFDSGEATLHSNDEAHSGASDEAAGQAIDVYVSLSAGSYRQTLAKGQIQVAIAQAMLHIRFAHAQFEPLLEGLHSEDSPVCLTVAVDESQAGKAESAVSWTIAPVDASILIGQGSRVRLGRIRPIQPDWSLVAIAQTSAQQVCILDAEGLWRHDIAPNKHGIVERRLALSLHESVLSPHLCRIKLCDSRLEPCPAAEPHSSRLDEADLVAIIQDVLDAPTSNLLDLAQRARLVVETDLSRINLRGASLSGLDLSSVDLSYANLRGADLTDAELSEANLCGAKLSGADLSGADLGSANLSDCDLHRASLALANLSGTNLSRANLQDTNLSQTNLNGVRVNEARFSASADMPESLKSLLLERGALFV